MTDCRPCGQCGERLPEDSPHGVCPSCLMRLGMELLDSAGTQSHLGGHLRFVPPKPSDLAELFPQLEILTLIGQGGMGAVYKARQVGLDRVVALKILPPHTGDDGSFAGRFEREARALARLSHPHIVTVFDSGHAGDFYYFVMEYVDGVNLREAINAGTLSPTEALAIVPQICDALQYAHDEGVVHRDIKPENVLIDSKGNTKIADFGLARLLGPAGDDRLTGTHQVMGTPRYMSPEQMEGAHHVDHRADIYSLGVVFYEMLTGELPMGRFEGPSKKVQVDVRLDDVVFRTLEKEPARRYQHASEIKTDVQAICRQGSDEARPDGIRHRAFHRRRSGAGPLPHFEYRSATRLFGLPLLHVAFGADPQSGRVCRARGIVAIGNIATGVLAIGTVAYGGVALGAWAVGGLAMGGGALGALTLAGVSLGLFSAGGIAIGLCLATGGLAMGFGVSYGGIALGAIARGGLAVGLYANGGDGIALGLHAMGGNVAIPDERAVSLFAFFRSTSARLAVAALSLMTFASFLVGLLISVHLLWRAAHDAAADRGPRKTNSGPGPFGKQPPIWQRPPHAHLSPWGLVFVVLVVAGCAAIGIAVAVARGVGGGSTQPRRAQVADLPDTLPASKILPKSGSDGASPYGDSMNDPLVERIDWVIWTEEGPALDPGIGAPERWLTAEQVAGITEILREAHLAYVELEQQHRQQETNAAGHRVTAVQIDDSSRLTLLEDQVWTKLDALVDVQWQELLRQNLDLQSAGDIGVLGFEGGRGMVEIWSVGSWFHWQLSTKSARRSGWGGMRAEMGGGMGMEMAGMSEMGMSGGIGMGMSDGPPPAARRGVGPGGVGSTLEPSGLHVRTPEQAGPRLPYRLRRFWNRPAELPVDTAEEAAP